jgi:hypothetical protein
MNSKPQNSRPHRRPYAPGELEEIIQLKETLEKQQKKYARGFFVCNGKVYSIQFRTQQHETDDVDHTKIATWTIYNPSIFANDNHIAVKDFLEKLETEPTSAVKNRFAQFMTQKRKVAVDGLRDCNGSLPKEELYPFVVHEIARDDKNTYLVVCKNSRDEVVDCPQAYLFTAEQRLEEIRMFGF